MQDKLKQYSVKKLNIVCKKKEVWCYGCGKRFNDILQMYSNELFIKKITTIIDSNKSLQGREKIINSKKLYIESPEYAFNKEVKDVILLITADRYNDIYQQIKDAADQKGIICIVYPFYYYNYSKLLIKIMNIFKMKQQIVFCTGKEPHENAIAVVEYLEKEKNNKWNIVFIEDDKTKKNKKYFNIKIKNIKKNTLKVKNSFWENIKYCYYMSTSKFLFYENEPLNKFRKEQKLIFMNHGVLPLKNVSDVLKQPDELDYALCPSKECTDIYRTQYNVLPEKQVYIISPRINLLKEHKLNKVINYKKEVQIIIWLPTFRRLKNSDRSDSNSKEVLPFFADEKNIYQIDDFLKKNKQILLIKLHPREKDVLQLPENLNSIMLLTDEMMEKENVLLQEILDDTSALITDYSSIAFEYLLLNKQIGYVVNDMDDYSRGFSVTNPMEYMVGKKIFSLIDLLDFFDDIKYNRDNYINDRLVLSEKIYHGNQYQNGAKMLVESLEYL